MSRINGKKIRAITLILFALFLLQNIYAVNTLKQYTNSSKEYVLTKQLCLLAGVSGPSSATPISGDELLIALNRINPNVLPSIYQEKYLSLISAITEPERIISYDVFYATADPSINFETYIQTSNNEELSNQDWIVKYKDRLDMITIPVEIGISNYFFGETEIELARQFENYGNFFSDYFSTNYSLDLQKSIPYIADAVIGTPYLHFFIGRNTQSIGNGYTGNLMLGDNFLFQDFAKFSIHTSPFTFNLSLSFFDTQKNSEIEKDWTYGDGTQLNNFSFSGPQQIRIVQNYQFTLFKKATIYINFGSLFDAQNGFDLRMLNPFIILHNYFDYTSYNGNDYGDGAALEANNHMSFALDYTFLPGWKMYFEAMIDQFQLAGEHSSIAVEPPNAFGLLLNFTNSTVVNDGLLTSYIEGVYTTPNLYLNEKYTDGQTIRHDNVDGLYDYYYWNQDLILGNSIWWGNDISYTGYQYGPDTVVIEVGSEYEKNNWLVGGNLHFRMHGEQGIQFHENQHSNIYNSNSVWNIALTGTIEYSLIAQLYAEWAPFDYLTFRGNIAHIEQFNYRNNNGNYFNNTQFVFGVIFKPVNIFK